VALAEVNRTVAEPSSFISAGVLRRKGHIRGQQSYGESNHQKSFDHDVKLLRLLFAIGL